MSICLAMICKNESAFIRTALDSVKHLIDHWAIVDTGSTDGTQAIILKEMAGIPGVLFERPWLNWSHNRTEAINFAKLSGCNFVLLLDADEKLLVPADFKWPTLDANLAYWMTIQYGAISYARPNLLSTKYNWHYVGVTHEYLTADPDVPPVVVLPISIQTNPVRTDKTPEKCALDAKLLEEALLTEPRNSRYVFYLAQSYKDCGDINKALKNYEARSKMGGWFEEVWYSYFQLAELKQRASFPEAEVISAYLQAFEENPARAESLGALARYLRLRKKYNLAFHAAAIAKEILRPNERLFVDNSYYQWRCQDEYSIAAYWTGHYRECYDTCAMLLKGSELPAHERERVRKNQKFAQDKLPASALKKNYGEPLVSAIMLTKDRARYIPQAISCFLLQTYENSELIILDDGTEPIQHLIPKNPRIVYKHLDEVETIGAKRNAACKLAIGEVIIAWDDDDWSHPYRIESQVKRLQASGRQLTGYNSHLYWDETNEKPYRFVSPGPYASGSSQCFWKTWWEQHPFPDIQSGEDREMSASAARAGELDCRDGGQMLVARAHSGNTWKPPLGDAMFPACDRDEFPPEFFRPIE